MSNVVSTRHQPADEQLIDETIIDRYLKRGPKLVHILVDAYLAEAPGYFRRLQSAVQAGDMPSASAAAHGLKSSSYNLGAIRLAKICQNAETVAGEGNADKLTDVVQQVGPTLFDTEEALKGIKLSAAV